MKFKSHYFVFHGYETETPSCRGSGQDYRERHQLEVVAARELALERVGAARLEQARRSGAGDCWAACFLFLFLRCHLNRAALGFGVDSVNLLL